jgi:hypothetical protein
MTLKCLGHTNGFTGTFTGALVNIGSNVSDAVFDGCRLESSGTSSPTEGLSLHGTLTRVTVSNLLIKNIKVGIAGSAKTFFVRVTGNRCENLWGTCIAFYFGTDRDLEIDNNTVVNHQRGGTAGHAGIQLGGISATSNEDKHSRVNVHHNTVDNSASCPPNNGDLVGIGLDQVSSSTIDDNVVRHCTDQQTSDPSQRGNGEGIVVVGPDNTVRRNQVYNVGSGAYTFISGSTPPQQVRNLIFQGNLADGNPADGGNQGVALSFAPSGLPMTGLLIGGPNSEHRNRILEHSYGIQAYSFGGTVSGSNNTIQNNDLTGNILGPCLILSGLQYTSISNVPSC